MTSKFLIAAVSASFLFGATAMAAEPKAPAPSRAVQKPLLAAQAANNKKDYPAALAAIETAKQVSDRTPYDNYVINRFAAQAHIGLKDYAAAAVAAEAVADSDPAVIPEAEKGAVYNTAMQLAAIAKHNDKAVKYAKVLIAMTPPPANLDMSQVAMALFNGADYATASTVAQKNIDAATAAGQKPAQNDLIILMSGYVKQNDQPNAQKIMEILIANYDKKEDWDQMLSIALTTKGMREIDYIYLGRLMVQQGRTISASDAQLIGSAANSNRVGLYGDAEVMQKFGGPAPDPRAAQDKATLAKQIADGAKLDGEYNVKTAEAVYGYGDFAKAEALARAAKTKPGVKDANEPDMVIAMALTAQGKYAEAAPIFDSIKESNPATARVTRLWGYFVKSKAAPTTAAAQ